jgi:NAD(P)-dependent dehydrogenase (short-subunit alcohol dehydrogenase family)
MAGTQAPTAAGAGILSGRVAVVTGGSRGIGQAIARRLGEAGASVLICSSTPGAAARAAEGLRAAGLRCLGVDCDVGERAQVEALFQHALRAYGGVDFWVNNAGASGPFALTTDIAPDAWERVVRVNLLGCYYGCRVVLPHLLERGYGKIVNLSGGGANKAQRFLSAYSSSKAAVVRLSDGLAREYADRKGIGINVLEPGIVATELLERPEVIGEQAQEALKQLPWVLRTFGTSVEEAADLALHMLSPAGDGISGRVFSVMPKRRAFYRLAASLLRR